ncbi:hypothetical protein AOLI_G00277680 [Acnodon oligacanthus]
MFIWHQQLFLVFAASHSLQYFYTGVTSEINFPEFSVVGLVDGEQFVYYDSNIRKMIPKTEWMEKSVGEDYWTRETQKAQGAQETFKASVSLFQKDSSSQVVRHATGFFPKAVLISLQKNGEDLHEDVELRDTLPNQDGTFQKRSILTVSPEELTRHDYTCIIQHSSLEEEMVLQVSDNRVLSET